MRSHLVKYQTIYLAISALMQSISLGIYLSLIATYIDQEKTFIEIYRTLGNWNILLFTSIISVIFNIWIIFVSKSIQSQDKAQIINQILQNSSKALVYPSNRKHIRAIVTVCNYKKNTRKTTYAYNISASPERTAEYDIYFGITGEAIQKKVTVAKNLPYNHIDTYTEPHKTLVEPNLKCVLAAPIFSKNNPDHVVGVLAFDSCDNLDAMKFNTFESKEIAQSWADILSHLM
jgi:hypothetical protein